MLVDITIAIPVKNEEQNLPHCLDALGKDFAKAIVLIDSGSTDRTRAIAAEYGVDFIDFTWDGKFPKKRNWFLQSGYLQTQWVLFLDADEYVTPAFKEELRQALHQTEKVGFWLNYSIYFMGKQLKGGYPLRKLALFRADAGQYERIEEDAWSKMDMEVHEHPVLQGKVGMIKSKIDHRDFKGISHYVRKHDEYSSWEASRFAKAFQTQEVRKHWTWKQWMKYKLLHSPLIGPAYFLGSFILMGGFKDGSRGLAFSILKTAYFTQIYCKIQEQ
ncbi:glycosyltransferase family 2 protein [Siphonobacter curvatus]|uniref:Glycosyltransferase family 2 protein n=1 Tax=Siphonobacter curvatus TaxID=2094562 RepID=A0A2S7IEU3_9BACT|nr:glycosyltransferase family 2 protein [Siphonobacter curvatus]PQA53166.1 glycosyltransferase family 2 protein [Siphonobacter curvatus]